jgi:hypothetical protein
MINWWAVTDLNRGPKDYESSAPPKISLGHPNSGEPAATQETRKNGRA